MSFSIDISLNMRTIPPKILKSKLFQWSVVCGIVLFHLLFYSELLVLLKIDLIEGQHECNLHYIRYFATFVYVEISISCLIPFSAIMVTSIVTIRLLMKSREALRRMRIVDKQRRIRDMNYAFTSVALNIFFIAFKIPLLVSPLIKSSRHFLDVSILLYLINCSSKFFIQLFMNSLFRREILMIIKKTPITLF